MSAGRKVSCPGCGGEVPVATAASRVAACPYCANTLVVNEAAIRALGKMALLSETPSCLAVGWPARLKNREIRVRGRIQYRYDAGLWDEWWIEFADDGSTAWISQDEGEYMLEKPVTADVEVPDFDAIEPGDTVKLGRRELVVMEKGRADIVGIQGEIPFDAGPDRTMRFLDLADDRVRATVEYLEDGAAEVYQGFSLGRRDLTSKRPGGAPAVAPPWPEPAEARPPGKERKPILRSEATLVPKRASCASCGGTLELRDADGTVMVKCGHCGSVLDVSVPGTAKLLYESSSKKLPFPVEIGAKGRFRGAEWTVIGRVRYRQRDDSGVYTWDEAQLKNPDEGYAFLALEDGHWMFFRPLSRPVTANPKRLTAKKKVRHGGQTFKVFEKGTARITHVEGELSWVAREGDRVRFLDAIRPPWMLSAEWSGQEMEWSLGTWLAPEAVAQAFGIPVKKLPRPKGVAPAQPFLRTRAQLVRALAGLAAALLLAVWGAYAYFGVKGEPVLPATDIRGSDYLSEQGWISPPFEIPEGDHICRLDVLAPTIDNAWVSLSVAFLDGEERVVLDADADLERYHGTRGGSWSEGSRDDYALFKLTGPGEYRLNVFGAAGGWSESSGDHAIEGGPPVRIALRRDLLPARYFLIAAFLAALIPIWEFGRQALFEGRRWPSDD